MKISADRETQPAHTGLSLSLSLSVSVSTWGVCTRVYACPGVSVDGYSGGCRKHAFYVHSLDARVQVYLRPKEMWALHAPSGLAFVFEYRLVIP